MKVDKVGVMKPQSHVKKAWKTPGYMSRLHDPHYESLEPQKPPHCLKVLAMIVEHSGGPIHTYPWWAIQIPFSQPMACRQWTLNSSPNFVFLHFGNDGNLTFPPSYVDGIHKIVYQKGTSGLQLITLIESM